MNKLTVYYKSKIEEISFNKEALIDDLLKDLSISIDRPCGGEGGCGKCLIKIVKGNYSFVKSNYLLNQELLDEGYALSCQTKILGDCTVNLMDNDNPLTLENPTVVSDNNDYPIHPLTKRYFLDLSNQKNDNCPSDYDRIIDRLDKLIDGGSNYIAGLSFIKKVPSVIREKQGEITVEVRQSAERVDLIDLWPSNQMKNHYGIACDLGTTTIALSLVDLSNGNIISKVSGINQQKTFGSDIISRIEHGKNQKGLCKLKKLVLKSINQLIERILKDSKIEGEYISNVAISGNTTMIHLLLGINPDYIRKSPYTPAVLDLPNMEAFKIGLEYINPNSPVYFSPAVGSYVGGDIVAGLSCINLNDDIMIFLDMGTNGELVVGTKEWLMTLACSAGPAFEGSGISCGMFATAGAIDKIDINPDNHKINSFVINGGKAKGVCGSGLIQLLSRAYSLRIIDKAGRLNLESFPTIIDVDQNGERRLKIVDAKDSFYGVDLYLKQSDISNLIRTKAAIFSAIVLALKKVDLTADQISRFYIAGGFGEHLYIKDAINIGLLPNLDISKFTYLGNTALKGAINALLYREKRSQLRGLSRMMTYIDLSSEHQYMDEFIAAQFIPHTNQELFQ